MTKSAHAEVKPLQIVHLYPEEMNIYGDTGNRIVLEKRLAWRNIPYEVYQMPVGGSVPKDADIIIGGGGQDASQGAVSADLLLQSSDICRLAEDGCVMLMVCGLYQLFGNRFVTSDGQEIKGIGVLPIETIAKKGRLIGNIHVGSDGLGTLVGYENHSGRTYLEPGATPFASVTMGNGNNDDNGFEGCRVKNVFGTYMHGPILSKNPDFADQLISLALERRGLDPELSKLDDSLATKAREIALKRPR